MLYRKLKAFVDMGAVHASAFGGIHHTEKTPYWPNLDVMKLIQLNPDLDIDTMLDVSARNYVGSESKTLVELWDLVEDAISYMPMIPLYSHFGFVWLRAWVRPLTSNLEAVPADERAYFERFMVTTPNNPSINDLGQDVLFQLITEESGRTMAGQFDANVFPRIELALNKIDEAMATASDEARIVYQDLRDRTVAIKCWAMTQRNTCAWVAGVYGYIRTNDVSEKSGFKKDLQDMIDLDLENTKTLLNLLDTSSTEVLMLSDVGETSFIYGDNICELLERKIELTENTETLNRTLIETLCGDSTSVSV
jgi:hypothetical protein